MIVGRYDNIRRYEDILPGLDEALKAACAAEDLPVGRYEFPGGYFMIQEGQTKPMEEGTYEVHRKYIDVQVLLKGSEEIAWSDPSGLETVIPYNEERDVSRLQGNKDFHLEITEGMFWAAYPEDAHQAVSHTETQHTYRKLVIKLPVKGE
ncbi:MAG: YhcH/YjgK/YiaL family protein [Solobacterium sp.]|nr:YhcH/YjgK/YiaL family protein [Solobacterium sp.]